MNTLLAWKNECYNEVSKLSIRAQEFQEFQPMQTSNLNLLQRFDLPRHFLLTYASFAPTFYSYLQQCRKELLSLKCAPRP